MNKLWSLFNSQTSEQKDGLTEADLEAQFKQVKIEDLDYYFVWSDHLTDWKKIKETPELAEMQNRLNEPKKMKAPTPPLPPPVPKMIHTSHSVHPTVSLNKKNESQDLDDHNSFDSFDEKTSVAIKLRPSHSSSTNSKDKKEIEFPELRKHKRYPVKLKVLIRSKDTIFRTFTTNISLGGVALQHSIPSVLIDQPCQLLLTPENSRENIKFNVLILDKGTGTRLQFTDGEKSVERLRNWLEKYIQSTTKKQKSA